MKLKVFDNVNAEYIRFYILFKRYKINCLKGDKVSCKLQPYLFFLHLSKIKLKLENKDKLSYFQIGKWSGYTDSDMKEPWFKVRYFVQIDKLYDQFVSQ